MCGTIKILDRPKSKYIDFRFPFQCIALECVGVWPINPDVLTRAPGHIFALAILYCSWSWFMLTLVGLTCLAQTWFVIASWGDIFTVTECGCTVLMGLHNLMRLIHLNGHRGKLLQLNRMFVRDIWISRFKCEKIAAECERDNRIYRYVSALMFLLICMYVLVPLYELFMAPDSNIKPFPYKMVFPYDANHGIVYGLTYFFTSCAGFGVVCTLFSEDSLFGFYVSHVCGQFSMLHNKIATLQRVCNDNYRSRRGQHQVKEHMDLILLKHRKIMRFCENMQAFFSPILLINFTISSMLICLVGFQIAAVKMSLGNMAKLLVYIVSALSQLFILCRTGNKLIDMSSETAKEIYACDWHLNIGEYKSTAERRSYIGFIKAVMFVIQRSQTPICVTAMQFSVLSLKSFAAILSTSCSYFTLLQSIMAKNE